MWSYYGAKTNLVKLYPPPKHGKIIEPFAGSARYALEYFDRDITLVDKYDVVIDVWHYLQQASPQDILGLPRPKYGELVSDFNITTQEKQLLGFLIGSGLESPRNKLSTRKGLDRPNHVNFNLKRIADNLHKIRHWNIMHGTFWILPNYEATWFIDPPYQYGGHIYKASNRDIDFDLLGAWARHRKGQVIVCENTKATWMDFKPMVKQRGSVHSTTEAIWSNLPTAFDNEQQVLL